MTETDEAFWTAAIAPMPRGERRFPRGRELQEVVEHKCVSLRGWNYPHVPHNDVGQSIVELPDGGLEVTVNILRYREVWRFHPTGVFTHRWRLREDGTSLRGTLHYVAAIYTVCEVLEFGRRLFRDNESVDAVAYRITLEGVLGRPGSGDSFDDLPYHRRIQRDSFEYVLTVGGADLVVGVLDAAVDGAVSLFRQLGVPDISQSFIYRKAEAFLAGRNVI